MAKAFNFKSHTVALGGLLLLAVSLCVLGVVTVAVRISVLVLIISLISLIIVAVLYYNRTMPTQNAQA